jgi:ElaB/YqjD/DUF883 family membrane-anchored ribosome-binding protein
MAGNSSRPTLEEARKATAAAAAETQRVVSDLADRATRAARERVDGLKGPARDYADYAGERFDEAQTYVVERINEKPVAAAAIALGIGVVIGLLLASGRNR